MNINPGKLDKKIEIIATVNKKNGNGFLEKEEKLFKSPWAQVSQKSANEHFKANTELATSQKRFLIRYIKGITYDMFIRYANNDYDIIYLNDYEERHEYIEIIGEMRGANGRIGT